jgi:hypothetical protein
MIIFRFIISDTHCEWDPQTDNAPSYFWSHLHPCPSNQSWYCNLWDQASTQCFPFLFDYKWTLNLRSRSRGWVFYCLFSFCVFIGPLSFCRSSWRRQREGHTFQGQAISVFFCDLCWGHHRVSLSNLCRSSFLFLC